MAEKTVDGIIFKQSKTWPTLWASACGLICYPSGCISPGSLHWTGYRRLCWYPVPGGPQKQALVHRVVADSWLEQAAANWQVDHISGDKQDNRLVNLRYVSSRENGQNKKSHREESASAGRYVGCSWCKRYQKWLAQILVKGLRKNLGYYATVEQAARAYDNALLAEGLPPVNFPMLVSKDL